MIAHLNLPPLSLGTTPPPPYYNTIYFVYDDTLEHTPSLFYIFSANAANFDMTNLGIININ